MIQKRGRPLLPHSHAFNVGLRGGQPNPAAGRHGWRLENTNPNYERLRDKGPAPRRECGRTCTCNAFVCRLTGERRYVSCPCYPVGIPAVRFWAIGTRVFNLLILLTYPFALDRFRFPCISLFHHALISICSMEPYLHFKSHTYYSRNRPTSSPNLSERMVFLPHQ